MKQFIIGISIMYISLILPVIMYLIGWLDIHNIVFWFFGDLSLLLIGFQIARYSLD